jgi:hypothetical protein
MVAKVFILIFGILHYRGANLVTNLLLEREKKSKTLFLQLLSIMMTE